MKSILLLLLLIVQSDSFKEAQLKNARVKAAYTEKEKVVKSLFAEKKLDFYGFQLFLRVFKKERNLEVWVKEKSKEEFTLLHTYPFCSTSGTLGPKRKEGDLQIPEGSYHINHFNPLSNFHLSLGASYPNASDKILSDKQHPGGSIYIHGNCVTIGCIPITDDKIKELYILAVEARNNGQEKIPIHIFSDRLDVGIPEKLTREYSANESVAGFWKNLQSIYMDFKTTKKLKKVTVNDEGEYQLK